VRRFLYRVVYRGDRAGGGGVASRICVHAVDAEQAMELVRTYLRRHWRINEAAGDKILFKEVRLIEDGETYVLAPENIEAVLAYMQQRVEKGGTE
jgi:antitoxin component HigA of HigAB toxin-antitoxin module